MKAKYILIKNIDSSRGLYKCTGCNRDLIRFHTNIKSGKSKSCQQCGSGFFTLPKKIAHLYKTKIYNIWDSMVRRSTNTNHRDYHKYGGIGRQLETKSWFKFKNFHRDMGKSFDEHVSMYGIKNTSLDRINNNKGYSKNNCRWATRKEQNNNTSRNRIMAVKGVSKTLSEWSELYNIKYQNIQCRIKHGWTVEDAITLPIKTKKYDK